MRPGTGHEAPSLGLGSGAVTVVPWDPRWRDEFVQAAAALHDTLGASILAVHHVGSTAVPGLCAKPVLDVLVSVSSLERSLELAPRLAALGYEHRPGDAIAGRHFFRRMRDGARTHHLSLAEPTSRFHRVTLAFRDALRADPAEAERYAGLKLELARRFARDRTAYVEGKAGYISAVLARVDRR